ncbi:signal recognition particle subunit FFH/SRP54 (srp54) [Tistlia consotensis]|uniref:Signal recognition particle protein n=1 Tax=Tistlia consotensis USBA 355 TaxID=560819 RepID=A0A1Y6BLL1_9PROT|nr:signal recognition particle protein [Tistlia consotensis]SMF09865.1 signal recognition particle subunit FFH/SRP54 (srp54) [Tistlia consotensis USBA 355]SNR34205.1 signal recognition particle subunit FFH/SRP54 (srp54) [Tistlia consotensis]
MFESLQSRLSDVFGKLTRRGALSEADVQAALREVRVALLEADVALPVVKDFVERVRDKAVGQEVLRSVTPGQQVVKIVNDELVEMLGGAGAQGDSGTGLDLAATPPVPVMLVGLQGSGKTTSCGKIAVRLKDRERKKVLMASLDVRRPAAQQQLAVLGQQAGVATLPIVPGEPPVAIARRAMTTGALEGYDVVLLDTAGRLAIDEALMAEVAEVREAVKPRETLLVADAMTGQDAVNVAQAFNERVGVTGIVLTRVDGDARGGAALSMRAVTGRPIKLLGVGEKLDALEAFHPDRVASRILGMGDIVSLVERAAETIEAEEAEKLARKLEKGKFDLDDMAQQLRQLTKMGGLSQLMNLLPGTPKIQQQMKNAKIDDKMVKRQIAIISSMTAQERRHPEVIKASRRQRIAAGSGTSVPEVNKLLKQFADASKMMKRVQKLGKKGLARAGLPGLGGPGGGMGGGGMGGGLPPGFGKRR